MAKQKTDKKKSGKTSADKTNSKPELKELDFKATIDNENLTTEKEATNESISTVKEPSAVDRENIFYLQIHQGNFLRFFTSALILPAKLISNRPFLDLQSKSPDHLLLSKGIINQLSNEDVLIEVILDGNDLEGHKTDAQIVWLSRPIPISRIKGIYVQNESVKKTITANATIGNAGLIPDHLFKIDRFNSIKTVPPPEEIPLETVISTKEIKRFDRILGAIAYNRNISYLYTQSSEEISNYTDHFLGMLLAISNLPPIDAVKKELINYYKQLFGVDQSGIHPINKWLFERATQDKSFLDVDTTAFQSLFLQNVSNPNAKHDAERIFKVLYSNIDRRKAPHLIQEIKEKDFGYLTIFIFLRLYANLNSEDRTLARKEIPNLTSPTYSEFIFSLLGFFYGYSHLLNNDLSPQTNNDFLRLIFKKIGQPTIKFSLKSSLDYFIIEAVYQFVFNETRISELPIELNEIAHLPSLKFHSSDVPKSFDFSELTISNTQLFKITPKRIQTELSNKLAKVPELIPYGTDLGLFCSRNNIEYIVLDSNSLFNRDTILEKARRFILFKKASLLDALSANKLDKPELEQRIDLSFKNKDF